MAHLVERDQIDGSLKLAEHGEQDAAALLKAGAGKRRLEVDDFAVIQQVRYVQTDAAMSRRKRARPVVRRRSICERGMRCEDGGIGTARKAAAVVERDRRRRAAAPKYPSPPRPCGSGRGR